MEDVEQLYTKYAKYAELFPELKNTCYHRYDQDKSDGIKEEIKDIFKKIY